ncbi:hypothetical protein [Siphonobacter sp. SORGH_AS_0500]|uniref:hypothetical protein n=1 Tax=Siphonobacter sp. SORGH_AS_0500 TaxID=1864824 RepID=UPI000CC02A0F|nr:hypothetical protein [Siphonobacter sp. SORGH_AS_0500]MDR6196207.1 hypothetical protein [Siphonobacter sp. SORGH_AS_0500]PKK38171.1 hypothetical protein BWI96_03620 [Siphonobacter sp. SORGH_AS_0500]
MKIVSIFILAFLLYACSPKVQVVTLQSDNVTLQDNKFVYDTDTLRITYNFQGENGVIRMNIYNKLGVPLYVDWKRSAFIKGTEKFDYWVDEAYFQGQYNGTTGTDLRPSLNRYNQFLYGYTWGSFQGIIRKEEQVSFIPPKTEINQSRFMVAPGKGWQLPTFESTIEEVELPSSESNHKKKTALVRYEFSNKNTPLSFRNYLTLSTDAQFRTEFHIDTPFYASQVENMDGRYLFGPMYSEADLNTPSSIHHIREGYRSENRFLLKLPIN